MTALKQKLLDKWHDILPHKDNEFVESLIDIIADQSEACEWYWMHWNSTKDEIRKIGYRFSDESLKRTKQKLKEIGMET
jgi:hypothetical protein